MTEQKPVFKIGDRVTWVHTSSGKHVASWSLREGIIENIITGDIAVIRYGKQTNYIPLQDLEKAKERMSRIVESFR